MNDNLKTKNGNSKTKNDNKERNDNPKTIMITKKEMIIPPQSLQ